MQNLTALIVDDESNCRDNLEFLINDYCPHVTILGKADSADAARDFLADNSPDLVFLDIAMPGEDGFTFLKSLEKRDFIVIFTTAHNEFALKAFRENAIDYLEKPINIEELISSVEKAGNYIDQAVPQDEMIGKIIEQAIRLNEAGKISIPTRDGYIIVDEKEIVHLEASDNYTMIYLTDARKHLSSKNIKIYEDNLDGLRFFRTHKSHIINVKDHLREFSRSNGNVALLSNGSSIPVSRRKLAEFIGKINTF